MNLTNLHEEHSILKRGADESAFAKSSCHHVLTSPLLRHQTTGAVVIEEISNARDRHGFHHRGGRRHY